MTRPQVLKRQVLSEKFRPDDVGVYEPSKTRKMMELELITVQYLCMLTQSKLLFK